MNRTLVAALLASVCLIPALAQTAQAQSWDFTPHYDLPRKAGPAREKMTATVATLLSAPTPLRFNGMTSTDSRTLQVGFDSSRDFTIELWMLDHVNRPVGAVVSPAATSGGAPWLLGYTDGQAAFGPAGTAMSKIPDYKDEWRHVVGVRQGDVWRLYSNGALIATTTARLNRPAAAPLDLTTFLEAEPYMTLPDLVRGAALYDRALSPAEVQAAFTARTTLVDEGRLNAETLHFTQPPYLNAPTTQDIQLSWETDRTARFTVAWGENEAQMRSIEVPAAEDGRLGGATLDGLRADTPYFYRVTASTDDGKTLDSGLLSFRSAPLPGAPFVIAVSADTEARPFVNSRMSQLIWEERPNLLLLAGDLTDEGSIDRRYQWTHEYFVGMGGLFGRVPVIAAPGNGEGEQHWFRHYHRQPGEEGYFSHRYGDVEFFILDSNLEDRERRSPGFRARQAAWLDQALARSTARWKIAMHHHDLFTSDDDDYGDSWRDRSTNGDQTMRREFSSIYERHGVDLVIYGHLHAYERTWPMRQGAVDLQHGVTYLQVGGMGGNPEDFAPNKPAFSAKTARTHHYVMLRGAGDRIDVEMTDIEGRTRDRFALTK
ncbi:metallophosphoesterase [Brevundimonas sp.]|uniref:metallophosphoesterase n=2 Tax=Brevundimonas TaxID=41275 RepID=UPI0025B89A36|nr:metallophosphoesterase [Brevundimonas sp.]